MKTKDLKAVEIYLFFWYFDLSFDCSPCSADKQAGFGCRQTVLQTLVQSLSDNNLSFIRFFGKCICIH